MGEQVGRQERDQGDGRGFTPCGRAGGRTQGQLTTFLKIASSTSTLLLFCFWNGSGQIWVIWIFCQLEWTRPLSRNKMLVSINIIAAIQISYNNNKVYKYACHIMFQMIIDYIFIENIVKLTFSSWWCCRWFQLRCFLLWHSPTSGWADVEKISLSFRGRHIKVTSRSRCNIALNIFALRELHSYTL